MFLYPSGLLDTDPRHRALSLLLANDPALLDFVLDPTRRRLRQSPRRLRRDARNFPSGERILVRIALDLWNGSGRARLADVVRRLDPVRLEGFLLAVQFLGFSGVLGRCDGDLDDDPAGNLHLTH